MVGEEEICDHANTIVGVAYGVPGLLMMHGSERRVEAACNEVMARGKGEIKRSAIRDRLEADDL